jgi:hypothetical protein
MKHEATAPTERSPKNSTAIIHKIIIAKNIMNLIDIFLFSFVIIPPQECFFSAIESWICPRQVNIEGIFRSQALCMIMQLRLLRNFLIV